MKRTALILIILSILSKPLGFIRQLLLSYFFGATNITDAYFVSTSALGLIMIYFGAISTSYIPTYNKILKKDNQKKAYKFTNNLISIQLLLSIFIIGFILFFADLIVYVLATGFDADTSHIASNLIIVLSISIPFIVMSGELSSFLNIKNKSVQRSLSQYTGHLIIVFVILAGLYSIYFLAIGGVVCSIVFALLLIYLCNNQGFTLKLRLSFDANIRYALLFALPMVFNNSIVLINKIVDQNIGSRLGEGVVSAINYSASIQSLLIDGVISLIIINIIFPKLSYLSAHSPQEAVLTFRKVLIIMQCITIPISFLFMFFASDIVSFIYQRGGFDINAVHMTATVLSIMSMELPFMIYNLLCNNMLFAHHLSKWPLILSIVVVITNIVFSLILSHFYGLVGLISGTVISTIFGAVTSAVIFKYKIASLDLLNLFSKLIRILLISLLVVLIAYKLRCFMNLYLTRSLTVFLYIFISSLIYLFLLQFVKIEEITIIRQTVQKYLREKF